MDTTTYALVFSFCLLSFVWVRYYSARTLSLPPGPKPLPILGNIWDLCHMKKHPWLSYADWAATYGDVLHFNVAGKSLIVLNSAKTTTELFEKRSYNYADRPDMPMLRDLMNMDWDFGVMHYGDRWRLHRRVFHQYFQQGAISIHHNAQKSAVSDLLRSLRDEPEEFSSHIRHCVGSIILYTVYGHKAAPKDDTLVRLAQDGMEALSQVMNTGSFLVDYFPILKYVPSWVPGAGFKRQARVWTQLTADMRDRPLAQASRQAEDKSYVATSLRGLQESSAPLEWGESVEELVNNSAGVAYMAGADTTVSLLLSFVLAMVRNPLVQARAQQEIDEIIGKNRLPSFEDRPSLPYIEAVLSESLRWMPVIPLGLVHSNIKEDVYNGYFIPAGAMFFGNIWAILHDPIAYPEPESFNPERFLGENRALDPSKYAFGFGRRVCPGRYLAIETAWIGIVALLSAFSFFPVIDSNGEKIIPDADCTSGAVVQPLPFKCIIAPRSLEAVELIDRGYDSDAS